MKAAEWVRRHPIYDWTDTLNYESDYGCSMCKITSSCHREVYDRHGWTVLCEPDFMRVRISMGRHHKRPRTRGR